MNTNKDSKTYKIDYNLFSAFEIIKIIEFFNLIEQTKTKKVSNDLLIEKYREYQNILRSKTLEKQYDKMLFEKSKVSIYHTMKAIMENR